MNPERAELHHLMVGYALPKAAAVDPFPVNLIPVAFAGSGKVITTRNNTDLVTPRVTY